MLKQGLGIFIALILISCSDRISEKKMVQILSEMYISDATISAGANIIQSNFGETPNKIFFNDSTYYYDAIFKKYKVDRYKFRDTYLLYAQETQKMDKLYKKVLNNLEDIKSQYIEPARQERIAKNLWSKTDSMTISRNTGFNPERFNVQLVDTGVYTISMQVLFEANDSTVNPRMMVYLYSRSDTIVKDSVFIEKDSVFRSYEIFVPFYNEDYEHLQVNWIQYDSVKTKTTLIYGYSNKKKIKLRDSISGGEFYTLKNFTVKYNKELSEEIEAKTK